MWLFPIRRPKFCKVLKDTDAEVLKDTDAGRNLVRFDDVDDMFEQLGI